MLLESALCLTLSSFNLTKDEIISRVEIVESERFKTPISDAEIERLFRLLLNEVGDGLDNR
jgi:hypothetical protein